MTELHAPRRNRYYYGKLMDVEHFSMEQRYLLDQQRQLNRLVLGTGVLSGLGISAVQSGAEHGLRVEPGLVIDGWGRLVVLPASVDLLPLSLTDECGATLPAAEGPLPTHLVVQLCYRECETDYGPALVPDPCCDCPPSGEAGTWVESYALCVREDTAPKSTQACTEEVSALLRQGRLQEVLCALTPTDAAVPDDPCVPLANVTVAEDGTLTVEACASRPTVPTNQMLLELIACLAQRVDECCGATPTPTPTPDPTPTPNPTPTPTPTPDPTPTPTPDPTPTPTPEPERYLAVRSVALLAGVGGMVKIAHPTDEGEISWSREPSGVEFEFVNAIVDPSTVVAGTTIEVLRNGAAFSGAISWVAGNRMDFKPVGTFLEGDYKVTLRGDMPAVMSTSVGAVPPHALDGEAGSFWPTGDGRPGGNYEFTFHVVP